MRITVAPRDGAPPFQPEVIAFEMDVDLILRMDRPPEAPEEGTGELVSAMAQASAHRRGDVLWLPGEPEAPVCAMLLIHDLEQEPSWDENAITMALGNLLDEAAARGMTQIALPMLGTVHGRLPPERFPTLLHSALVRAEDAPDDVWVMAEDAAVVSSVREMLEEAR
jgi:O-acetyl-ADP-ribose deacetylase (regulator of RNase III)